MKKNFVIFSAVGICVLLLIFTVDKNVYGDRDKKNSVTPIEDRTEVVDNKMNEVIESDEYNNMSISERKELVYDILLKLEQDGYIIGLSYDNDNYLYSIKYIDGTLGGWRIKGFETQEGFLPMN